MASKTYEKRGDSAGYSVRETAKGWTVDTWSRWQGSVTGRRVLVPFGAGGYREGAHLDGEHNEGCTVGEYIAHLASEGTGRVLRAGHKVQ